MQGRDRNLAPAGAARSTNKTVVVYLPTGAGSREMLVASAASRIIMGPQATILPLGVAVETRYFRRTLDKIGVLPEIFARGEFKPLANLWPVTRCRASRGSRLVPSSMCSRAS